MSTSGKYAPHVGKSRRLQASLEAWALDQVQGGALLLPRYVALPRSLSLGFPAVQWGVLQQQSSLEMHCRLGTTMSVRGLTRTWTLRPTIAAVEDPEKPRESL